MLPNIRKILYTTDLSDKTRPVFRYTVSLAQHCQAKIILLHVLEPLGAFATALLETYMPEKDSDVLHRATEEVRLKIQERVERFYREELHSTASESHLIEDILVLEGHPAHTIVAQAKLLAVDLIVMGRHGYSTLGEILIGSTTRRVNQHSSVPVLIVPMHTQQDAPKSWQ